MKVDPGLESTREVRTRISRDHGNDPRRLVAYYMEYQKRHADRLRWASVRERAQEQAAEQQA